MVYLHARRVCERARERRDSECKVDCRGYVYRCVSVPFLCLSEGKGGREHLILPLSFIAQNATGVFSFSVKGDPLPRLLCPVSLCMAARQQAGRQAGSRCQRRASGQRYSDKRRHAKCLPLELASLNSRPQAPIQGSSMCGLPRRRMPQREADGTVLAVLALWHVGFSTHVCITWLDRSGPYQAPSWVRLCHPGTGCRRLNYS
jgi:hypothetical protein